MTEPVEFVNPFEDLSRSTKTPDSCLLVIFGATGDLTARKLIPAIYNLSKEGQLPSHFACVAFARRKKTHEQFREEMKEAIQKFSRSGIDDNVWKSLSEHIYYHCSEFHEDEGYESLQKFLHQLDNQLGTRGNHLYYLSTQPSFFPLIIEKLHKHKLIYPVTQKDKWSRIIIEKPFGHDYQSAVNLQKEIAKYLDESQIFRIDHYLGKETVQNILVFRFTNPIFEASWNNRHIDNIQISVSEEQGIGTRGRFWEEAGMLRDIVQNHMMQLLSLVAMEPPINFLANSIRDEKVKVIQSIRPFPKNIEQGIVRGQYGKGFIDGKEVIGYREEENVDKNSDVETFVAAKIYIDNWRWAGVPFYLRAGKRLPIRTTEIAISFKDAPNYLFKKDGYNIESNVLVIRIQPDEGISLRMNCKVPGLAQTIQPVKMSFHYKSYFGSTPPEAYERLICDCMAGDSTLFARADELLASWKLFTPVLEYWLNKKADSSFIYPSGTWGPDSSDEILRKDGKKWRLI